jgi:ABC-type dipeptide/oligopeptide/nickel transport system ATPase component
MLGPVMGFVMLLRGIVCLHASAIAIGNEAIALVGPAGSGKSTTAAAFAERGYSVLAEDVVTLDDRGDRFLVRPGYPCIRLWPPAVKALYGSETHLPRLTPNWDKCYLDLSTRFQGEPLPLAAIYQLGERHHHSAAPFIVGLDRSEAMMALVANTYATKLMDKQMRAREFELLTRVVGSVSVQRVTPHADPARIKELCDRIVDDFSLTQRRKAAKKF